ncbi:MAG: NADPH:quinone reductase or related Zn-dependent oxidoreductase [Chloroflexi bacterium AL-W]|nr:NADPH:quinone reductase or related Zn-dependent oxidoreductase [Chloroflexi bacterium AL-W]
MRDTMYAIGFKQYGNPEVLQPLERSMPTLTPDSVLIKVVAAGVNPADTNFRRGAFRFVIRVKLPFVPGLDVAGIVAAVGENVHQFKVGDSVYAMLPTSEGGGYAEYAVVHSTTLSRLPANLSFMQASAVPLAALTAYQGLNEYARVQPNDKILIYGASGGVGTFAVQIARAMGADVTAVCSTRNLSLVEELGAHSIIDYTKQSVDALPRMYDTFFDTRAQFPFVKGAQAIKRGGRLLSLNPGMNNPISGLYAKRNGYDLRGFLVTPNGEDLRKITKLVEQGLVSPVIDRTYMLSEASQSHMYSETKRVSGKLVLRIDETQAE